MQLFRFPLSRHEICKAWANAMGKEISTGNSRVLKQKLESGN